MFYYIGRKKQGEREDAAYVWSGAFIGWMTTIIIVGRIIAISIAQGCSKMCRKKGVKSDVSFRELVFVSYGGMIRGAIAFGLVLKIPRNEGFRERGVVVTTTLAVVIITTVVFGTFMPLVQRLLFANEEDDADII